LEDSVPDLTSNTTNAFTWMYLDKPRKPLVNIAGFGVKISKGLFE